MINGKKLSVKVITERRLSLTFIFVEENSVKITGLVWTVCLCMINLKLSSSNFVGEYSITSFSLLESFSSFLEF